MILGLDGQPLRRCGREGCQAQATHYPEVIVPPRGYPVERGFRTTIGLTLCLTHAQEESAETWLTPEFKLMASAIIRSKSSIPLDFDRAIVNVRRLDDANWRGFVERSGQGRAGRRLN